MKRTVFSELVTTLEDKPLGVALTRLAIVAKQEGLKDLARWARHELGGYDEEIHKRSEDNQVPQYRNVPVVWRDVYGRRLNLQCIRDQHLFNLLSRWTMRQGILELEGYIESGNGITIIPERLHLLSQVAGCAMSGGDIASEAIIGLFKNIRAEALQRLSEVKLDNETLTPGSHSLISKLKGAVFGNSERAELRHLLNRALKSDSSLDAFCLDYFPQVHCQFSGGMDRNAKLNLLLQENLDELRHRLMSEATET